MRETYAVIPEGSTHPVAYFAHLKVAIDWGLRQYGSDGFRIRFARISDPLERPHPVGANG